VPLFQRRLRVVNWYGHRYHNDAHDNYVLCALKHGIEIQNIFWEARVTPSPLSRYAPIIVNRLTQALFTSYQFKMTELEAHLESVRQYAKVPPVSEIDWNALPAPGITPSLYAATQINMQIYDVKVDTPTHAADHYFCGVNFLSAQALTFSRRLHVLLYLFNLDYALRSRLYNFGALNQTLLMMAPGQFRQSLLRDCIKLAESIGADVNQQDMFGYSVLHYAALAKPAPKAWKALLDAGANPFLLSWGGTKSTPYEILISNQPHSSSLTVALRTIPAHELDRFLEGCLHQSPLNHAGGEIGAKGDIREARPDLRLLTLIVSNNDAPLRKYLDPLEGKEGAWTSDFVTQIVQRANGVYPLLIAACFKGSKTLPTLLSSLSIMKLLGINDESSVAAKKARGTALHYASANGLVDCVKLLIAAGADVNHTAPKYGRQTPLISACSTVVGAPCVPLLLEHMVNNAESLNYAPEPQKYTALHWAATWPKSCGPIFKMLLDTYSISPTAKDYRGRTPRDWAVGNPFRDSETGWLLTYFQDIA
jgi:ankyrin repeat protein